MTIYKSYLNTLYNIGNHNLIEQPIYLSIYLSKRAKHSISVASGVL